jgi:UDP-glucose 4-epimerase
MKKILITGALGFAGSNIGAYLTKKGLYTIGVAKSSTLPTQFSENIASDLQADFFSTLKKKHSHIDFVIHCAGSASVPVSVEHPQLDFEKNVLLTVQLSYWLQKFFPETTVVYLSSAAVYGNTTRLPIPETSALNPVSPYGVHKVMAENFCAMQAHNKKLKYLVLRIFSLYGNGLRKQLLWDACQKINRNEAKFHGTGKELRDWVHISDFCHLLYLIIQKESENFETLKILNIGSGVGVTTGDILQRILQGFSEFQAAPAHLDFSQLSHVGNPVHFVADVKSLSKFVDWQPKKELSVGVSEYVDWFKTLAL